MKRVVFLVLVSLISVFSFSQEVEKMSKWEYPNATLMIGSTEGDVIIEAEARLVQIIPTGKRRQSYVFVLAVMESVNQTMVFGEEENSESVSFSKKSFKPIEFELWFDEGGDKLLEFLQCNSDLPYMFVDEADNEKYNSPDFQPCLGQMIKISFLERTSGENKLHILLSVEKL
ncbi:MAG: hypothetical protein JXR36_02020 [Bacteroidales bacterium]|nr:hypothetical protein [Bacteroidales bacterium]